MAGDPYYDKVTLLLHFDGSDGATTFTDNSPAPKTVTPFSTAQISTAQSKFGGSSLLLNGSTDYLTIPDSAAWDMAGDFTVECWLYLAAAPTDVQQVILFNDTIQCYIKWPAALLSFYDDSIHSGGTEITAAVWHHAAWVRSGATISQYLNGVLEESHNYAGAITPSGLTIGMYMDGTSQPVNGHIDELRITNGIARYTAGFTPPVAPFEDFQEISAHGSSQYSLELAATVWQGAGSGEYALSAYRQRQGRGSAQHALPAFRSSQAKGSAQYTLSGWQLALGKGSAQYALTRFTTRQGKGSGQYQLTIYQVYQASGSARYQLDAYRLWQGYGNGQNALSAYVKLQASGSAQWLLNAGQAYYGYALNLTTGSLSKFDDFKFTSLAGLLGTDDEGIYALTGSTNNGAPINAFIETGTSDFKGVPGINHQQQKRVSDAYIAKSGGALKLTVTAENSEVAYDFRATDKLQTVKQNLAKGAKGRFWKLKLENVAGSEASMEAIELNVEVLSRKV